MEFKILTTILHFLKRLWADIFKFFKKIIFATIFLPIFFFFTIGNEICRLFVKVLLLPTSYRLIGNGSANFFNIPVEKRPAKFVLLLLTSPDPVCIIKERELWENSVLNDKAYSKFKRTICRKYGYGVWRDDTTDFDVKNHVKIYDSLKPLREDGCFTEEEVKRTILPELYKDDSATFSKPQWQWFVFPNYIDAEGRKKSARIFRYHHTYMDGVHAGLLLGERIFEWEGKNPNEKLSRPPFILDPKGEVSKKYTPSLLAKTALWFLFPVFLVKMLTTEKKQYNPGLFTTQLSWKTNFITEKIDLEPIRKFAAREKMPISTICATALRFALEYLFLLKGKPGGLTSLIAPLAVPPFTSGMKNRVAVTVADVPLNGEQVTINVDNPSQIHLLFSYMFGEWLGRLPTKLLELIPNGPELSTGLSNLPFTLTKGKINSGRIDEIYPFVLLNYPAGVVVGIASYGEEIFLTAVTDGVNFSYSQTKEFMNIFAEKLTKMCKGSWKQENYKLLYQEIKSV